METNNTIVAEKPTGKQVVCPICGLNLAVFYEMFGVPASCSELHGPVECPVCSKELR